MFERRNLVFYRDGGQSNNNWINSSFALYSSEEWTKISDDQKKELGVVKEDDGEFW